MFIMLCGADQNPNPLGSIELAWNHGKTLAAEVDRILGTVPSPSARPMRTVFQNNSVELRAVHATNIRERTHGR